MSAFRESKVKRQPVGTSKGGQFANKDHPENSQVYLSGFSDPHAGSFETGCESASQGAGKESAFAASANATLERLGWRPDYPEYEKQKQLLVAAQSGSGQVGNYGGHKPDFGYGRHMSRAKIVDIEARGELES